LGEQNHDRGVDVQDQRSHGETAKPQVKKALQFKIVPSPFRTHGQDDAAADAAFLEQPGQVRVRTRMGHQATVRPDGRGRLLDERPELLMDVYFRDSGIHRLLQPLEQEAAKLCRLQEVCLKIRFLHAPGTNKVKTADAEDRCLFQDPLQHYRSGQGKDQFHGWQNRGWGRKPYLDDETAAVAAHDEAASHLPVKHADPEPVPLPEAQHFPDMPGPPVPCFQPEQRTRQFFRLK
jgi:hypothetical protein